MAGQGQYYSFSDTVTPRKSISDVIDIIDPRETPILTLFGTNGQDVFNFTDWGNNKYRWLEDVLRPRSATLNEAMDTTETGMDVAATHGARFAVGDVWKFDETGELILVTAVTAGSDTVTTIVRNFTAAVGGSEGTAVSSVTTATTLTFLYTVRLEGADSTSSRWDVPVENSNFTQIMHHQIIESGSSQVAKRYGYSTFTEYTIAKVLGGMGAGKGKKGRAGDLLFDLENIFFSRAIKTERTASTVYGIAGGARTLISTNALDKTTTPTLTQPMLEDTLALCDGYGGRPDTIICNQFQWRLITSWFKDSVTRRNEETLGGMVIDTIRTIFGDLDIVFSRRCPASDLYIVEKDKIAYCTLRDWAVEPLGKTGDADKEQIVGEFGFVLKNEKAHALLYNLATS